MSTPDLHPWLSTPDAYTAARRAVSIPMGLLGTKALIVGADELLAEALIILTECALPPRSELRTDCLGCGGPLGDVRAGAKFCSTTCRTRNAKRVQRGKAEVIPPRTGAHIGSMWGWPETEMMKYAVREVGYLLANYLRTCTYSAETPASEAMAVSSSEASWKLMYASPDDDDPRDVIEAFLESKGIQVAGDEDFEDLAEAALHVRGEAHGTAMAMLA